MKAVLLAAGIGSRLRPLTNTTPKSLISVAGKPILQRMIENLVSVGITDILIVTGFQETAITTFIKRQFSDLPVQCIKNEYYSTTNTGYSLLLAESFIKQDDFLKIDADVVCEKAILEKLIISPTSALCIDKTIHLNKEEVKVTTDRRGNVVAVGKSLDPHIAQGESIGIEKITNKAGKVLFTLLADLMNYPDHYQDYYDDYYTTLVNQGVPFTSVDVTGLKWIEIDTPEDYQRATILFETPKT